VSNGSIGVKLPPSNAKYIAIWKHRCE